MGDTPNNSQIPHQTKHWRIRIAVLVSVVSVILVITMLVRSHRPEPTNAEKQILEKLTACGGRYELDGEGHVERVMLEGKNATDESLVDVHTLPYLKRLSLRNSSVSDKGLLAVVKCKRLRNLGLTNTNVTDAGLAHLRQMSSLQNIWVSENDKISPKAVAALRQALPATKVHITPKSIDENKNDRGARAEKYK